MIIQLCKSLDDMRTRTSALKASDPTWEILPVDQPADGVVGCLASRPVGSEDEEGAGEEVIWFQWLPFGELTRAETIVTSEKELLAALKVFGDKPYYRCDDPRTLLVGLVCYECTPGVAQIVRMRLMHFKCMSSSVQELRERAQLLSSLG